LDSALGPSNTLNVLKNLPALRVAFSASLSSTLAYFGLETGSCADSDSKLPVLEEIEVF
jgi:hypothetical protein